VTVEVTVIVEGQTEEQFIKRVVAPRLHGLNVFLKPLLMKTSSDARGGAITFERFIFNARNVLMSRPSSVLSCFIDLYQLDTGFPDHAAAAALIDLDARVHCLNSALHKAVVERFEIRPDRFIPHIQPHEFEGLLFSDVEALVRIEPLWSAKEQALSLVRATAQTPEHINNGFETKPSRRLEVLLQPTYKKTRHGPLAAHEIGLDAMEKECPHFKRWMDALRALSVA
jgi:hypothetical protein